MVTETETLASYLPGFVIDRINNDPQATVEARSETFYAGVMFADISGFTALTEWLEKQLKDNPENKARAAEQLRDRLNAWFGVLIDLIVSEHRGDIVKFAGDAILAIWRDDAAHLREATLNAVRCGLAIQSHLEAQENHPDGLALKINVAGGPVRILEIGGVFNRWDWTICGTPLVEIGKHAGAEPGQIVVAQPTWQLIADECQAEVHSPDTMRITSVVSAAPLDSEWKPWVRPDCSELLKRYVPYAVLHKIQVLQETKWVSDLRRITVLFVNLPDLNHESTLAETQATAVALQDSIYEYEGSVNKFSVDEKGVTLVAALGLPPLSHSDDPARGIKVATTIQRRLETLGVRCSVGVSTGRAFCGSLGNETRREYTVLGDIVNLAARLMQAADGGILCDEETFRSAEDNFQFEQRGPFSLKGRSEAVAVYAPIQEIACAQSRARHIGRVNSAQQLTKALQAYVADWNSASKTDASPRVLRISGPAGIGKSHFVANVLREQPAVRVLSGGGESAERSTPLFAWRGVFRDLFGGHPAEFDTQSWTRHIKDRLSFDDWLRERVPLLGPVLQIDAADNSLTSQMTGDVRADNTRELLLRLLQRAAAEKPLVVVLDDAHWFDSVTWSVLQRIQRGPLNALLLVMSRPSNENQAVQESFDELVNDRAVPHVVLQDLDRSDTDALIAATAQTDSVDDAAGELVFRQSGGHPYFVRELVLSLLDSDVLTVQDGAVRLTNQRTAAAGTADDSLPARLPNTLEGAITSRLDRLPPTECMVLKSASVIGRDFQLPLLSDIHPIACDRKEIPELLESLNDRELAQIAEETPETIWEFRHAVTRDVAYQLLLFQQRRELHMAIAVWHEEHGRQQGEHLPRLAWHWEHAQHPEKALQYFVRAGEFAREQGAYQEAQAFFQQALDRLPSDRRDTAARLHRQLGEATIELGGLEAGARELCRALECLGYAAPVSTFMLFLSTGVCGARLVLRRWFGRLFRRKTTSDSQDTIRRAARVYGLLCELYYLANENIHFLHASVRMQLLAQQAGPSRERALSNAIFCLTCGNTFPKSAQRHLARALEEEATINDAHISARIFMMAGVHDTGRGEWDAAREILGRGLARCQSIDDYRNFGILSVVVGASHYFQGHFSRALEIWNQLYDRALQRGDRLHEAWSNGGRALNFLRLGQLEECVNEAESALKMFRDNKDSVSEIATGGVLIQACLKLGRFERAGEVADFIESLIRKSLFPTGYYLLEGYAGVAEFRIEAYGRGEKNRRSRSEHRTAKRAIGKLANFAKLFPIGQPRLLLLKARFAELNNQPDAAAQLRRQSLHAAELLGMRFEAGLAHLAIATRGDGSEESEESARQIFSELGCPFEQNELEERAANH